MISLRGNTQAARALPRSLGHSSRGPGVPEAMATALGITVAMILIPEAVHSRRQRLGYARTLAASRDHPSGSIVKK